MSNIYAYNNRLWKEKYKYTYTGEPEEFILTPGEYLLMCNGATGGADSSRTASEHNHGGFACGILNLDESATMYAFVGGDGGNATGTTVGVGGFNGGGNGTPSTGSQYYCGAGGGGASDIRLIRDPDIPGGDDPTPTYTIKQLVWEITNTKSSGGYCQLMEFYLYDNNNQHISFSSATCSNQPSTSSEGPDKIIDNNINTKLCARYTNGTTMTITLTLTNETSTGDMKSFSYVTGNDSPERDPITWKLYVVTTDDEQILANEESGVSITGTRKAETQTFELSTSGPTPQPDYTRTLNSRILVAGGAGASSVIFNNVYLYPFYAGIGGSSVGGPVIGANVTENGWYASQIDGYEFGFGQTSTASGDAYDRCGRSGGGGGWFGGYASTRTNTQTVASNGGGGSSYVLTADSYKPEEYNADERFQMTHPCMIGGVAESASVIVCEAVDNVETGDTIIFFPTGEKQSIPLPGGNYTFKCWGGDGDTFDIYTNIARGGYAQGTLDISYPEMYHFYVGGSGCFGCLISEEFARTIYPPLGFNGGGLAGRYGVAASDCGCGGGGATDIRVGVDSLYSRIIVAGGAGGRGSGGIGGVGGGLTGGTGGGSHGRFCGPGLQTNPSYTTDVNFINPSGNQFGDFGKGGDGVLYSGTNYGPGGGGGWFGGSSIVPYDTATRGGYGGSGYVLTSDSYKPKGYLVNEDFYLTNTSFSTNTLHPGITKIEVVCNRVDDIRFLARDNEGIKKYDIDNDEWVLIPETTVDETLFMAKGVIYFKSDNGLQDEYDLLIYDENDDIKSVSMKVSPTKQTIRFRSETKMIPETKFVDSEYDPSDYRFDLICNREFVDDTVMLSTDLIIEPISDNESDIKIYLVQLLNGV